MGILLISLLSIICCTSNDKSTEASTDVQESSSTPSAKLSNIKDSIDVFPFEVIVNDFDLRNSIGNNYTHFKSEKGNVLLTISLTFKNMDTESRAFSGGILIIIMNDKKYFFDKEERPFIDGYQIKYDQINPLISKTVRLVYQIPKTIKGEAYFLLDNYNFVRLGEIKATQ